MKACIITIGNEILKGRTVNSNAAHIGRFLTSMGYEVERGIIVSDSLDEIAWAIGTAISRYRIIVTTGGLGPTFDDMTVEGISKALGLKLVEDRETMEFLRKRYRELKAELTTERLKLAMIPSGSRAIKNRVGAAPGILIEHEGSKILILPGVPKEMEAILEDAAPLLGGTDRYYHDYTERMPGIMESSIAPAVSRIMKENAGAVYIKSHPLKSETNDPEIDIEVSAYADSKDEARRKVESTMLELRKEAEEIRKRGGI